MRRRLPNRLPGIVLLTQSPVGVQDLRLSAALQNFQLVPNVREQRPASRQLSRLSGRRARFGAQRQVTCRQLVNLTVQLCFVDDLTIVDDGEKGVRILGQREELLLTIDADREALPDVTFLGNPFASHPGV